MIIAHAPIAYITNEAIQKKEISKLNLNQKILVMLFSFFFGILPDFDIFFLSSKNIPGFIHHEILSHTPIFYISIFILLKILLNPLYKMLNKKAANVIDKNILSILANTFLIATVSHLFADLIVSRIMLFYPLSDMKIFLFKYIFEPNLFAGYSFTPLFAIEIIIFLVFIYLIYNKFFKLNKLSTIFLKFLISISLLYLPFSIYMSFNTYNRSYMYDEDGQINYDVDYDTLEDGMDMDIGNDGRGNIEKANETELLDSTLKIVNSNKFTSSNEKSIASRIKYKFGAFDSYRLISQAYFDTGLPIEPVLEDFNSKKYGFESYGSNLNYISLLYEYLEKNNQIVELNLDSTVVLPISKIFFLMDKDEKIINLGITLEGNYLATILNSDRYLDMHSYQYIREYYKGEIEKIFIQR